MSSERAFGQEDASLESWAEGEPLNSLCHEFYPAMLAIARTNLGSPLRTRMDARDIVQTAFGEVLQRAGGYRNQLHFRRALVIGIRRGLLSVARHDRAGRITASVTLG